MGQQGRLLRTIDKKKGTWVGHMIRRDYLVRDLLKGTMDDGPKQERRRRKIFDDLKYNEKTIP